MEKKNKRVEWASEIGEREEKDWGEPEGWNEKVETAVAAKMVTIQWCRAKRSKEIGKEQEKGEMSVGPRKKECGSDTRDCTIVWPNNSMGGVGRQRRSRKQMECLNINAGFKESYNRMTR